MSKFIVLSVAVASLVLVSCQKVNKNETGPSKNDPAALGLVATNHETGHRILVLESVAEARATGKLLLIQSAGAWCSPCAKLEKQMTEDQAYQAVASNFVTLHLEEIATERLIMDDAMPFRPVTFPSFTVFDPRVNSWYRFSGSTSHRVVEILNRVVAGNAPTFEEALQGMTDYLATGGTFVDPDEDSYYHYWLVNNALGNSALNDDKATYETHLDQMQQLYDTYAEQTKKAWFESAFVTNARIALNTGKWTFEDLDARSGSLSADALDYSEKFGQTSNALRHQMSTGFDGFKKCEATYEQRLAGLPEFDDKAHRTVKTRCATENVYADLMDLPTAAQLTTEMAAFVDSGEQPALARDLAWLLFAQGRSAEAGDLMEKYRAVAVEKANKELKDFEANSKLGAEWHTAVQNVVTRVDTGYERLVNVLRSGSQHPAYDYVHAQ